MARKLETAANIAILVVALIAGVVLVRNLRERRAVARGNPDEQRLVGRTLALPNAQRVVLAVSTNCHYCTESAPFYRRLAATRVPMTVVLPQRAEVGRLYARQLGLTTSDVRQVSMRALEIRGTPTLLLVDGRGVVQRVWQGKLLPDDESEVLASLR